MANGSLTWQEAIGQRGAVQQHLEQGLTRITCQLADLLFSRPQVVQWRGGRSVPLCKAAHAS